MANQLDTVLAALSHPIRRHIVARLGDGRAAISDLAVPHGMALPSFLKHFDKLERAGLIRSRKNGRIRVCTLHPEALAVVDTWLDQQSSTWDHRLDRLNTFQRTDIP